MKDAGKDRLSVESGKLGRNDFKGRHLKKIWFEMAGAGRLRPREYISEPVSLYCNSYVEGDNCIQHEDGLVL